MVIHTREARRQCASPYWKGVLRSLTFRSFTEKVFRLVRFTRCNWSWYWYIIDNCSHIMESDSLWKCAVITRLMPLPFSAENFCGSFYRVCEWTSWILSLSQNELHFSLWDILKRTLYLFHTLPISLFFSFLTPTLWLLSLPKFNAFNFWLLFFILMPIGPLKIIFKELAAQILCLYYFSLIRVSCLECSGL